MRINEWRVGGSPSAARRRQPLRDRNMCFTPNGGVITRFELGSQNLLSIVPIPFDCLFCDVVFDSDFDNTPGAFYHLSFNHVSTYSARFCLVQLRRKTMSVFKSLPRYPN